MGVSPNNKITKISPFSNTSIASKLKVSLTLMVLLISSMVIGFNQYLAHQQTEAQLNKLSDEYIANLIESLELPLWSISDHTVQKIVSAYGNNEIVAYIKVTNSKGKIFEHVKNEQITPLISRTRRILHNSQIIGTVRIDISTAIYDKTNRRLLETSIINVIFVIAALFLMMQFLLNRFLRTPLNDLGRIVSSYINENVIIERKVPIEFQPFIDVLDTMSQEISRQLNALQASEKKYRQLFDNLVDVFYRVDLEGNISMVSPSFQKMFGYDKEEALTLNLANNFFVHPQKRKQLIEILEHDTFVEGFEAHLKHKNGKVIWGSISAKLFYDENGKVKGVEGTIRDITSKKNAQEIQIRLITAIEQAADLVMITDYKGIIEYVNPAFEITSGYSSKEILGKSPKIVQSDRHDNAFYRDLWETIAHGRVWKGHIINRKKDGSLFEIEAIISPIRDETSRIINYVAVSRDVTREVHLEKQLRQTQKLEAIGTLAGGIAHDFNNILAAMLGYCEIALLKDTDQKQIRVYLNRILNAGQRARDLVKHILTFSRQSEYHKVPNLIKPVINEVLSLLRASLPSSIEIKKDLQANSVIMADSTQIHQILMNLCTNAAYAMLPKGGILKIGLYQVKLDTDFVASAPNVTAGNFMQLSVSDSGEGMTHEIMERIFDPFFTTKDKEHGTGLGLSVVHGIVQDCNGLIKVHSEIGKGTVFDIYLPTIVKNEPMATVMEDQFEYGSERILFVDDEADLIDLGEHLLKKLGYQVTTVSNSLEALKIFSKNPQNVDLVITDLTMPKLSGDELARQLIAVRPDIPIILCTGYSQQLNEEKIKSLGIKGFITKPVIMKQLSQLIRQVLDSP